MQDDLISIVIPIYNRTNLLLPVLDSVKKQTYQNFEIIIVDDGSTESIREVLDKREFGLKIKYIRQNNHGAPHARNRGALEANGQFIIFWDADITAKNTALETLHRVLKKEKEAYFAYSNFKINFSLLFFNFYKQIKSKKFNLENLKKNNYIHSTALIRNESLPIWDEKLKRFQDWDYWLNISIKQKKTGTWVDEDLFIILSTGTISSWLPKFCYKKPWKYLPGIKKRVKNHDLAKKIILKKWNKQ